MTNINLPVDVQLGFAVVRLNELQEQLKARDEQIASHREALKEYADYGKLVFFNLAQEELAKEFK